MKNNIFKLLGVFCAVVVFFVGTVVGGIKLYMKRHDAIPKPVPPDGENVMGDEGESTYNKRFPFLKWNECTYNATNGRDNRCIGKKIGSTTLTYSGESTVADIYEIEGISSDLSLLIRFENDLDYYVYATDGYETDSWGGFLKGANILSYMEVNKVTFQHGMYNMISDEEVETQEFLKSLNLNDDHKIFYYEEVPSSFFESTEFEELLDIFDKKNREIDNKTYSSENTEFFKNNRLGKEIMSASVNYTLFGENNYSIKVYSGGFIATNIGGGRGKLIYIGREEVKEIESSMKEKIAFKKEFVGFNW
jgi:hypothetical protein